MSHPALVRFSSSQRLLSREQFDYQTTQTRAHQDVTASFEVPKLLPDLGTTVHNNSAHACPPRELARLIIDLHSTGSLAAIQQRATTAQPSSTCDASSRVGARTRHCGHAFRRPPPGIQPGGVCSSLVMAGKRKPPVLPEPVCLIIQ